MQITPAEIASIEDVGMLNGHPVKIITTKGGFRIALGRNSNKNQDEALAAGSHSAIVKFNLEKQYPSFQPNLMKSEISAIHSVVTKHSHCLSEDLQKSGHDIYSVQSGANIEFQITKHDVKVGSAQGLLEKDSMAMSNIEIAQEFYRPLAIATTEKALSCGASKVRIQK